MALSIDTLQNKSDSLNSQLDNSLTAYAPNTDPTKRDVGLNTQLSSVNKQIDTLKGTQLRNQWYGASTPNNADVPAEDTSGNGGFIMSGLKALQRPLNAVAGTAQYLLGKGTESSLTGNINKAMGTGLTFGNVLQQNGVPWAGAAPLGFALDVMFDPVNWLTAGTEALIPRIGTGLVKGAMGKAAVEGVTDVAESGMSGAIKAVRYGLTSNLERKAATAMKFVPMAGKFEPYANLAKNLGERAIAGSEKYDALTGTDVYRNLNKGILGMKPGIIGNTAENLIRKIPASPVTPSGNTIADFFKYSPQESAKAVQLRDQVGNLIKDTGAIPTRSEAGADFKTLAEFNDPNAAVMRIPEDIVDKADAVSMPIRDTITDTNGVITHPLKPEFVGENSLYKPITILDSEENAKELLGTSLSDENLKRLTKAYHVTPPGKTGVQWYDDFIQKAKDTSYNDIADYVRAKIGMSPVERIGHAADTLSGAGVAAVSASDVEQAVQEGADASTSIWNKINAGISGTVEGAKNINPGEWKPFEKILNGIEGYTNIMKFAKVATNIGSQVVNNIGNFVFPLMMGLPVHKPKYLEEMINAKRFVDGKLTPAGFKEMFFNDANSFAPMMEDNPGMFRSYSGMDVNDLKDKITLEEKIMGSMRGRWDEVLNEMSKQWENIDRGIAQSERIVGNTAELEKTMTPTEMKSFNKSVKRPLTATETLQKMSGVAPVSESEMPTSYSANELVMRNKSTVKKLRDYYADASARNPNDPIVYAANLLLNKLPTAYEHVDQIAKIASVNYMTKTGLTAEELTTVSRTVPINAEKDLLPPIVLDGEKYYRLIPIKAAEVSLETYMNYAAMPDAVKILRALPIVGSPFFSFQYAMAIKTAKTVLNNPEAFNKIGFMLNEISGQRTPAEKEAMKLKYNQYLNSPTVVKLFGMWNTDVKNIIPYYSMNMFNPSQKTYDTSTAQGKFLEALDNLPVFQDPIGQVYKDYILQPWILSGTGQAPQGNFGEPIYPSYDVNGKPINVSAGTKALYGTRALAEAIVPGSLGYLGLPAGLMGIDPSITNLVPSYGFRGIANATQGRSSVGAITKEDAVRKTLRAVLGRSGIPAYTLDTSKTASQTAGQ